jgi:hypothetical protein
MLYYEYSKIILLLKEDFSSIFYKHVWHILPGLFLKRVMYICLMDVILTCVINVKMKIYMLKIKCLAMCEPIK